MVSEERLKNWAWYCDWGHVGPEVRTTAASAEGNYESEDVFEGEEPRLEPDMLDGQLVDLEGIAWSESEPFALLNGKVVGIGELIRAYRVTEIQRDRVTLEQGDDRVVVRLK